MVVVFNAIFSNISVILLWSITLLNDVSKSKNTKLYMNRL